MNKCVALALVLAFALPACGGRSATVPKSTALSPSVVGPAQARVHAAFSITVKGAASQATSTARRPKYVSPSTQSIKYAVDGGAVQIQDITQTASNCAAAGGAVSCTVPLPNLTLGNHMLAITAWDGLQGFGDELGANSSVAFSVAVNQNNIVAVVIGGIATAIGLSPGGPGESGSVGQGFTIAEDGTKRSFTANPLDDDGNVIVGPGAPIITATSGSGAYTVAPGFGQNAFTVTVLPSQISPVPTSLDPIRLALAPVPGSGAAPLTQNVALYGVEPLVYVVGTNGQAAAYNQLGVAQNFPVAGSGIQSTVGLSDVAYDPATNALLSLGTSDVQTYTIYATNVASNDLAQGSVSLAPGVLAWDPTTRTTFGFDTVTKKLAQIGPGSAPSAITLLGAPQSAPYVAIASAQVPLGQAGYLFAATATTVFSLGYDGTSGSTVSASPGVGTINGLAFDPLTSILVVSGSLGVVALNVAFSSAPTTGFAGLTAPTAVAIDKYNGLVYVADAGGAIHLFDETGTFEGNFPTPGIVPNKLIITP